MKIEDYTIVIPSCNPPMQEYVYDYICHQAPSERVLKFNGSKYPSFSKLVNDSILSTKTEVVIICSDKFLPEKKNIDKMLYLLNDGYGLVGLYRFGFFGFTKHLIKTIGFMDENYTGGNYEDCDYQRRLKEADIAYYETEEVRRNDMIGESRWKTSNKEYYESKWREDETSIQRLISEPEYNYNLGEWPIRKFKSWRDSEMLIQSLQFKLKSVIQYRGIHTNV